MHVNGAQVLARDDSSQTTIALMALSATESSKKESEFFTLIVLPKAEEDSPCAPPMRNITVQYKALRPHEHVSIGPPQGSVSSVHVAVEESVVKQRGNLTARLIPLAGASDWSFKPDPTSGKHLAEVPLSTTGQYRLDLSYSGDSCVLLSEFNVNCKGGYTEQGPVCAKQCSSELPAIGSDGKCASAEAEVLIQDAVVSRRLTKPSETLASTDNRSDSTKLAYLKVQAKEKFDFTWMLKTLSCELSRLVRFTATWASVIACCNG